MYCPSCGKPLESNVRFCSACGIDVSAQTSQTYNTAPPPYTAFRTSGLVRPRYPRMIAGVCAAFSNQYGWDISLVRVLTVVLALLTSGIVGLAYLAAWIIIPEAPYTLPSAVGTTTGNPTV